MPPNKSAHWWWFDTVMCQEANTSLGPYHMMTFIIIICIYGQWSKTPVIPITLLIFHQYFTFQLPAAITLSLEKKITLQIAYSFYKWQSVGTYCVSTKTKNSLWNAQIIGIVLHCKMYLANLTTIKYCDIGATSLPNYVRWHAWDSHTFNEI